MTDKEKPNSQSNGRCAVELWRSNWIYMAAEHEISGFLILVYLMMLYMRRLLN